MEEFAAIGKIINTHGIKGGLKIQPLSDFPERVKKLRRVYLQRQGEAKAYDVADAFVHGRFWVMLLVGVDSCDRAEQLVGSLVSIPLSERVSLPNDVYYLDQIIGLEVYTVQGEYLGCVHDVLQTGSNDVYVVREPKEGGREALIPALKTVVQKIDIEQGRMDVDPPEGLL